jgi:6-phosphofructokinase 2
MNSIVTLTLNPVLDKDTSVAGVQPHIKLRCAYPEYYAGGGGLNVSRALKKLGSKSRAIYLAGGPAGRHLENLMEIENIKQQIIALKGWTRENLSVTDTLTNLQYRFGVPGPKVLKREWSKALKVVEASIHQGDYLVASGKLPPGIPNDFYSKIAVITQKKQAKLVLDTSGEALIQGALAGVFLLKPNLGELSTLCGVKSIDTSELESHVTRFMQKKTCEIMVVSLGARGALLATGEFMEHVAAPVVHQKSTIGAGDSMVAGMVQSLIKRKSYQEMLRYGIACGTAATLRKGTQLCAKEDADRIYKWIMQQKNEVT